VTGRHQLPAQGQYGRATADANAPGFAAIRANEGGPDRYGLLGAVKLLPVRITRADAFNRSICFQRERDSIPHLLFADHFIRTGR
jgi:hypothetical protein